MGLFDRGVDNDRAKKLAEAADGGSIEPKKIAKSSQGLTNLDFLNEKSIIAILSDGEQPHYHFSNQFKGIQRYEVNRDRCEEPGEYVKNNSKIQNNWSIESDNNHFSSLIITDQRILLLCPSNGIDYGVAIPLTHVQSANAKSGKTKNYISFQSGNYIYKFYIPKSFDFESEVSPACIYIRPLSDGDGDENIYEKEISHIIKINWEKDNSNNSLISGIRKSNGNEDDGEDIVEIEGDTEIESSSLIDFPDEYTVNVEDVRGLGIDAASLTIRFSDDSIEISKETGFTNTEYKYSISYNRIKQENIDVWTDKNHDMENRTRSLDAIVGSGGEWAIKEKKIFVELPLKNQELLVISASENTGKKLVKELREVTGQPLDIYSNQKEPGTPSDSDGGEEKGESIFDQIERLDKLNKDGIISDSEFEEKKEELLDRL
jgi:hypothetical protein